MAVPRVPDIRASMAEVGKTPRVLRGSVLFGSFAGEGRERGNFSLRRRPIQRVHPVPFHVAPEPLLGELAYARRLQRRSTRSSGARRRPISLASYISRCASTSTFQPPTEPVEVSPVRAEYDGVLDDRLLLDRLEHGVEVGCPHVPRRALVRGRAQKPLREAQCDDNTVLVVKRPRDRGFDTAECMVGSSALRSQVVKTTHQELAINTRKSSDFAGTEG